VKVSRFGLFPFASAMAGSETITLGECHSITEADAPGLERKAFHVPIVRSKIPEEDVKMKKPGILIEIPGFGKREIRLIVSDCTGTLSSSGRLAPGVREKLVALLGLVDIRIVSSDSFGTAKEELAGIVTPDILTKGTICRRRITLRDLNGSMLRPLETATMTDCS
jgi:hypothetical protein